MAKAYQIDLVVVAVATPAYVPEKKASFGVGAVSRPDEEIRRVAQGVLEQAASLAQANGIKPVCELREGRVADEILKGAEQHRCDLIIMGARGEREGSSVTLGEAGSEVVRKASVPVMVVK
jgi:nucleotide-binding universal stress UspA family protein